MSRRVVITADDLGREPGTTKVITELLAEGNVSATTLITVSPHAAEAAERVRALGVLPRLHLTLTGERGLAGWRPLSGAASLVGAGGELVDDPFVLQRQAETADVMLEAEAQLAWMRGQGLAPEAADSHAGTLYGLHGRSWLKETLQWCGRNNLGFRLPRDAEPYVGGPLPAPMAQAHEQAVELADALGVRIPQTIVTTQVAVVGSYEQLRDEYRRRLENLPEGTSEIFLHPSSVETLRAWEARLLRDPLWHKAIEAEAIEVVGRW